MVISMKKKIPAQLEPGFSMAFVVDNGNLLCLF